MFAKMRMLRWSGNTLRDEIRNEFIYKMLEVTPNKDVMSEN